MHERHRALGLDVVPEPPDDALHRASRVAVEGEMRALRPTRDLAREESVRATEHVEPDRGGFDAMQVGEHLHEIRRDPRRLIGSAGERRRKLRPDRDARTILHEEEGGAQDRGVLAQVERARRERKRPPQLREHPMLAHHVVRPGRQRPRRRPTQHARRPVHIQPVVEVGESRRELARRRVQPEPMAVGFQVAGEARPVLIDGVGAEIHLERGAVIPSGPLMLTKMGILTPRSNHSRW